MKGGPHVDARNYGDQNIVCLIARRRQGRRNCLIDGKWEGRGQGEDYKHRLEDVTSKLGWNNWFKVLKVPPKVLLGS